MARFVSCGLVFGGSLAIVLFAAAGLASEKLKYQKLIHLILH